MARIGATFDARWAVMKKTWLSALLLLLLAGCNERDQVETYTNTNDTQLQNEVAQLFKQEDNIERVNILLVENELFVAMQLKPFSKWNKQKIEKKWQQKIEQQFEQQTVLVSTDFKLYWETSKLLEEKSQQKVQQKLQHLKKLSKEET